MKDNMVRKQMIEAALGLFQRQGYAETSWRELVQEAGTPWGSAYHYFPGGKEELAAEAVNEYGNRFKELFEGICAAHPEPAERVRAWFQMAALSMRENNFALGCPMAGISLNAVPKSQALSELCKRGFESWRNYLAEKLGSGLDRAQASERATAVLSLFEGSLVLARSLASEQPFITAAATAAGIFQNP